MLGYPMVPPVGEVSEVGNLDRPQSRFSEFRLDINCRRERGGAVQDNQGLLAP
jgi:hypothetical protein